MGETGHRLLVVDDDLAVLRIVRGALQNSGFEVSTATSAGEALQQLTNGEPEAVVLDVGTPEGRAFFREMRNRGCSAPVLILSTYDARRAQRELNAEGCMNKPFDPEELRAALLELMQTDR